MSKRKFKDSERYAIYTVHGEKCYMCGTPIDLLSMEVDHILPESLIENSELLSKTLNEYGLPNDFDLQSILNLLPSCSPCNKRKRETIFNPTPRIQIELQRAKSKKEEVELLIDKTVSNRIMSKAWNSIKRASNDGNLRDNIQNEIKEFALIHVKNRESQSLNTPLKLTPLIEFSNDEFAKLIMEDISEDAKRLQNLELSSKLLLSDLNQKWVPYQKLIEELILSRVKALNGNGHNIKIQEATSRPKLFEALDGWKGGANPKNIAIKVVFDHADLMFYVHPGAIIQGELTRFAQLSIRTDWRSGAGEPFMQLMIHSSTAEYYVTTDAISRTRIKSDLSQGNFMEEVKEAIKTAVEGSIK